MPLITSLTARPLAVSITQAAAREIAIQLGPWVTLVQEPNNGEYARGERATLVYAGDDFLSNGATLDCWANGRARLSDGQYEWRASMHVKQNGKSSYLMDVLSPALRAAFIGSIKISARKPLARIAREVEARLIAHYLPAYRYAMEVLHQQSTQREADVALAQELAAILGCTVECIQHGAQGGPCLYCAPWLWPLRIENNGASLERITNLTGEQARQLCALVAQWKKP